MGTGTGMGMGTGMGGEGIRRVVVGNVGCGSTVRDGGWMGDEMRRDEERWEGRAG